MILRARQEQKARALFPKGRLPIIFLRIGGLKKKMAGMQGGRDRRIKRRGVGGASLPVEWQNRPSVI